MSEEIFGVELTAKAYAQPSDLLCAGVVYQIRYSSSERILIRTSL